MSRLVKNQIDFDQSQQVEADIAALLSRNESAVVEKATLENGYGIFDATEGEQEGPLHDKCASIVRVLNEKFGIDATYSVMDGTVRFFPAQPGIACV